MYEELINRLKNLATLEVKNGESYLNVTAEATAAIREIAQEAADAIEELQKAVNFHKFNSAFWEDKYNSLADEIEAEDNDD